jgi:NAD(P)-dependent dehydrogenase (short-subunit alcohol dehydrogenase family)
MAQIASYFNFAGKVAIITGGSTGIGRATSHFFARHGAKIVISDVNPEGLETNKVRALLDTLARLTNC